MAEAAAEEDSQGMRAPRLRVREEDATLGLEPVERDRAERLRDVREEAAHLFARPARPEHRRRLVDQAVDIELPPPRGEEREVLHEVREP